MTTLSTSNGNKDLVKTILECFEMIKELYPGWKPNEQLSLNLWHRALKGYDPVIIKKAAWNVATKSKFVPKLAEVLEEIKSIEGKNYKALENNNQAHVQPFLEEDKEFARLSQEERGRQKELVMRYVKGEDVELTEYQLYLAGIEKELSELCKRKGWVYEY